MTGLAVDQTARLNALGLPVGGPIIAGGSCQVTFEFFDESGKSLKVSTPLSVTPGQAVHFDLERADIDSGVDRREIRGTVRSGLVLPPGVAVPVAVGPCSILPTLEVFNQDSGRTMVELGHLQSLPLVIPLVGAN